MEGQARLAKRVLPLDIGLLYCTAELYEELGLDEFLLSKPGLEGPGLGELLPDKEDSDSSEGSDSLFEE